MSSYARSTRCPHCFCEHDVAATMTGGRPPRDGDVSICWRCLGLAVFAASAFGMILRRPTPSEEDTFRADPRTRAALAAAAEAKTPEQAEQLYRGGGDG